MITTPYWDNDPSITSGAENLRPFQLEVKEDEDDGIQFTATAPDGQVFPLSMTEFQTCFRHSVNGVLYGYAALKSLSKYDYIITTQPPTSLPEDRDGDVGFIDNRLAVRLDGRDFISLHSGVVKGKTIYLTHGLLPTLEGTWVPFGRIEDLPGSFTDAPIISGGEVFAIKGEVEDWWVEMGNRPFNGVMADACNQKWSQYQDGKLVGEGPSRSVISRRADLVVLLKNGDILPHPIGVRCWEKR